jgi:hypothetical protein
MSGCRRVRLSPEQVAYMIDHASASTLLVNDEFVDLVHSMLPSCQRSGSLSSWRP